jgi:hypothetical protein
LFEDQYHFRNQLIESLERDLMGPSSPDEIIEDPPITRYVAGVLFPQDAGIVDASEDVGDDDADPTSNDVEGGEWDPAVSMSRVRYPSSLGLTFAVSTAVTTVIVVHAEAARYEPVERTEESAGGGSMSSSAGSAHPFGRRAQSRDQPDWRRIRLDIQPVELDVSHATEGHMEKLEEGLSLFTRVRPADESGRVSVTLILINTRTSGSSLGRDAESYFQPKLRVEARSGQPAFVHRPAVDAQSEDEDVESHRLLYRGAVSIATGHGTAVGWDEASDDGRCASAVWTCIIPRFELALSDSNPDIPTDELRMINFVQAPRDESLASLQRLRAQYEDWINGIDQRIPSLEEALQSTARRHVDRCRDAARRMGRGIELLASDSDAWEAFRIANRAMLMQRARTDWLAGSEHDTPPSLDGDHRWRPFQVAFILLCLPGISSPASEERNLADLLWFPTGGGKTEAYLGLLAFTTALRRIREPANGHGVTVIMRYTLRLLTIQQFERAALLICCLEAIRRGDARLGEKPIEIGLWVGRGATPNTLAEAKVAIDKLRQGVRLQTSNPLQVQRCPWCATAIEAWGLWIAKSPPRLVTSCRNDKCDFEDGLPVRVVDEDIYAQHPTLIIATADKFASMPWREDCRSLFNADLPRVAPPDLIIQDELHLISGPLGTLAGLYETAVDLLCTAEGRRPKVIASTATIRRADSQTAALFDRDVRQFPPPGLDAADSFFAREAPADMKATRLYVGVTAPGTSQTTLLVRTYAALLQAAQEIDGVESVKDPYWTLVGYFNSLRVLGGARMQVQDDVNDRLDLLSALHGQPRREIPVDRRIELTSREASGDIPDHLRRMAITLPDLDTLDVILATNMISVGVDINRLGLMAVMGQPQSTSEYIQATSRVGRRHPGLIITMLNAAKSRDRSHYESFRDYHATLYRQVESSSVTPFSTQARSRGLHAVLIALARLTVAELRPNDGARRIAAFIDRLTPAKEAILDRVRRVEPAEAEATASELDQILAQWVLRAEHDTDLVYANPRHPDKALLGDAGLAGEDFQSTFPTLWSLRDVDLSSNLYQVV